MNLPLIRLDKEQISNFDDSIQKEWIVSNGLGGYASSTVLSINTRKYHGLLVAAFHPPGDRRVCLSKVDEEVTIGNSTYPLGANEFKEEIFPRGFGFLQEFSLSPFPSQIYSVQSVEMKKAVFMPREINAVIIIYSVLNGGDTGARVTVSPMLNGRHFHSVTDRWRTPVEIEQEGKDDGTFLRVGFPKAMMAVKSTSGLYREKERWIEKVFYREEAQRGESCLDDCFQPGHFEIDVDAKEKEDFAVVAVADGNEDEVHRILNGFPSSIDDLEDLFRKEKARYENLLTDFSHEHGSIQHADWIGWVVLAMDTFIVRGLDAQLKTVIAGYHWFEGWGRDTFVALPGLALVTGRFEDAQRILSIAKYCQNGLIPNFIPDREGPPAYNTVDATLWFVNAVLQYLKYTGDFRFVRDQLWDIMKSIVDYHVKGTDFGVRLDNDDLLCHGPQLTWMDAAVDGIPVTPRVGKAVEIQALWFNTLKIVELLANRFKEETLAEECALRAERARKSFAEKFWNSERECLFDVIDISGKDDSLRPNQIIAASLDFAMLDSVKRERVVDFVHHEFLAPCGLRTLARNDARYVGVYAGDRRSRDKAYHNGSVWPWLIGPFATAFLKIKGYSDFRRDYVFRNCITPLLAKQISVNGLGTINEIFDGDEPHKHAGCISQAWSVAEPFRAYVEDVMQVRPKYEREVLQGLG